MEKKDPKEKTGPGEKGGQTERGGLEKPEERGEKDYSQTQEYWRSHKEINRRWKLGKGMMSNQDDHYFTRMSDVRKEIEDHLFPTLGDTLKAMTQEQRLWVMNLVEEKIKELREEVPDLDKLAGIITKLDTRVEYLEKQIREKDLELKEKENKSEEDIK